MYFFLNIHKTGDNVHSNRDDDDYNNVDGEIPVMKYVDFNSHN